MYFRKFRYTFCTGIQGKGKYPIKAHDQRFRATGRIKMSSRDGKFVAKKMNSFFPRTIPEWNKYSDIHLINTAQSEPPVPPTGPQQLCD